MKTKRLLRIAALLMLLHTAGHTLGALTWKQAPNNRIAGVIRGMQSEHFDFMGRQVSLGSFYAGYGYGMIAVLLLVSGALWLLSTAPEPKLILLFALFLLIFGAIELTWFFPFAATFSLLTGLLTGWSYLKLIRPK